MFGRLFKPVNPSPALLSDGEKAAINNERADFASAARHSAINYEACRVALLKAGGARLDHPPGYTDPWETAIRRLVERGELREQIEYGRFPEGRAYRYVLTPAGEVAAGNSSRSD